MKEAKKKKYAVHMLSVESETKKPQNDKKSHGS